jgi:hypothetical protein
MTPSLPFLGLVVSCKLVENWGRKPQPTHHTKQAKTMTKLSANQAAKEAGVAKKTLLDAISSGKLSAAKNDNGHWEIEPSELFRVYPKTSSEEIEKPTLTPLENRQRASETSALEVEVKMLREQIERMDAERDRERSQLTDQIEALKAQAERQSADHRQALAVLTDQRDKTPEKPKRGLWARLMG